MAFETPRAWLYSASQVAAIIGVSITVVTGFTPDDGAIAANGGAGTIWVGAAKTNLSLAHRRASIAIDAVSIVAGFVSADQPIATGPTAVFIVALRAGPSPCHWTHPDCAPVVWSDRCAVEGDGIDADGLRNLERSVYDMATDKDRIMGTSPRAYCPDTRVRITRDPSAPMMPELVPPRQ